MTNEQLIEKFNPANGANLTPEDLLAMRALTDEQISVLAKAYPNQPTRRSYIRLFDTNIAENKQLFQLSTWQNLNNLRKYSSKKNLIPFDFLTQNSRFNQVKAPAKGIAAPKKVVVDLTAQAAAAELTQALKKTKTEKAEKTAKETENFVEKMSKAKAAKAAAKAQQQTTIPPSENFPAID